MSDQPPMADPKVWAQVARLAELGVMTSSLLHELRQPLFAIKALAELSAVDGPPEVGTRMRALLEQVQHVESLVGHYGGLGRVDEVTALFDLRQPLERAAAMFGHRARQLGVDLITDLGSDALWVRGRESGVRQMAINLLQNALDACEARPERRVVLQAAQVGDRVWFEVRDTGGGVPEALRAQLFEPFVTSKPAGRGTGLGLHITRMLAESAGGSVDIASETGVGTRVRVQLPRAEPG